MDQSRVDCVLDTLDALQYDDVEAAEAALGDGLSSLAVRNLISFLAQQCSDVDAVVSKQDEGDDPDLFIIELASFIKEAQCPIPELQTDIRSALSAPETLLKLLGTGSARESCFPSPDSPSLFFTHPSHSLTLSSLRVSRERGMRLSLPAEAEER